MTRHITALLKLLISVALSLVSFAVIRTAFENGWSPSNLVLQTIAVCFFGSLMASLYFFISGLVWLYRDRQFKNVFGFAPPPTRDAKLIAYLDPAVEAVFNKLAEKCGEAVIVEAKIFNAREQVSMDAPSAVTPAMQRLRNATATKEYAIKRYSRARKSATQFGFTVGTPWQRRLSTQTELELQSARP